MKKILFSLVAMMFATVIYAQSSLTATLSHEGSISTFYGINALKEAYAASVDGDVITLSEGAFNAISIGKAITLRGVGMFNDDVNGTGKTILQGNFNIQLTDYQAGKLTFEGIYHDGLIYFYNYVENLTFIKCRLKTLQVYYDKSALLSATFIHCHITGSIEGKSGLNQKTISFINCFVAMPMPLGSQFELQNCIISNTQNSRELWRFTNSILRNCIITGYQTNNDYLHESSIAYNCVYIGENDIFAKGNNGSTNHVVNDYGEIFKTFEGTYKESESFDLTDEAKSKYLGQDGTEIGIYGGNLPFEATMSNPRITKYKVASKSTADGKLSVEIEVKAAE